MIKQKAAQNKQTFQRNHALNALQATVFNFFNTPSQSKYCLCEVCLQNYEVKEKGRQFLKQSSSMFNIDGPKMKKFYQFISSLDQKIFFKLQIPEICFFEGGEGKVFFKTKGPGIVQVQMTPQFRKQIPNFFLDSKKVSNNLIPSFGDNKYNHIKYFDSIVPSFKHGLSNDNLDNRPKNYTFHNSQKNQEQSITYKVHQNAAAQVAIVKHKDKALQLVNQKQLRSIMKSNTKTQNIELIQSYIKPHEKQSEFIFSEYVQYRKPDNVLMFNRSLIQMKTQIGLLSRFSKDYIPLQYLQEYEQMLKEMPQQYCLYQTYKMTHYMEINRDIRVKHLTTVWFKDQSREIAFFGVAHFDYEQNEKVTTDVSNIIELKDVMKTELTDLQKQLLGVWQNMKKRKSKTSTIDKTVFDRQQSLKQQIQMIKHDSKQKKITEIINHKKSNQSN